MTEDTMTVVIAHCPGCKTTGKVELHDSVNFGNLIGECFACGDQFDYTPIDHKGIYREARRGFL